METIPWNEPAPGDLAAVQRFVNTADLEDRTDQLTDPQQLATWLHAAGLCGPDAAFDESDRRRLIDFREALRRLLLSHNGGEVDAATRAALDAAGRDAHVQVTFGPAGEATLEPAAGGVDGVVGRLLAIVARADADGSWERLKACASDTCMAAFYDRSRNHSRTWCTMSTCGNRAKARNYRARQR